jgi:hypothetical protein
MTINAEIVTHPKSREDNSNRSLEELKTLIKELLSGEFPSVRLLRHPKSAYWGTWEFVDEGCLGLPN